MPSFRQVLQAVTQAWRERRDEAEQAAEHIAQALAGRRPAGSGEGAAEPTPPSREDLARAVRLLARDHDAERGGFGGAPKFPPSMVLEWLLRHAANGGETAALALDMAQDTLRHMAFSGMYDQVEGGFARYSVDAEWVVPHFEKMLYDNALLARVYLHWWRLSGDALGRRIALETCDWMLHRLATDEGGLASALDADTAVEGSTHGVEGLTYVWTPDELLEALGTDDGPWAAQALGVTPAGTFEHGTSTVRLLVDVDSPSADPADVERWLRVRDTLREKRSARPQPARDDKVVAAWNGLAVAALAETGALLDRPDLVDAARRAATLLLEVHVVDGRLRRVSRDGRVGEPAAVLEDHGDVVDGLLALHAATGERRWLDAARPLADAVVERFHDPDRGFSDTPLDAPDPLLHSALGSTEHRTADPADNAYPSGPSAAAHALVTWAALTGDERASRAATSALDAARRVAGGSPRFAGWGLAAAEAVLDGPREVAVVGVPDDESTLALLRAAREGTAPGLVVAVGHPRDERPAVPLLADRPGGERAVAYPCRGMVCDLPTSDPDTLRAFTRPAP
jgi:uncharacterized protein YyaL (SSP411 family)